VLDGFTITGGQDALGGGMRVVGSSPTVTNCTFLNNWAQRGGGMYSENSSPEVMSCTFLENHAAWWIPESNGGGMYNADSSPTVRDCRFLWNEALDNGAGMYNATSSPVVANCVFAHNFAPWPMSEPRGGGMYNAGSDPTVTGCTFIGNNVLHDGGAMYNDSSSPTVANCILWGDSPNEISGNGTPTVTYSNIEDGFPGTGNIDAEPLFVDPDHGDYRLAPESPSIDAGDNTAVPEDITTDLAGNPRFLEIPETPDTGHGDPPIVDMGAYEALGGGCLAIINQEVICPGDGPAFTVTVQGLDACTGGTTTLTFTGSGGAVGEDFCALLLVSTGQGGFCCSTELCVAVPDCTPSAPPGDIDGDGAVGVLDLLALLSAWGQVGVAADLDGGGVGISDFLILLAWWGASP
jgi:hypothetical protein